MKILYSKTFRYILAGIAILAILFTGAIGYKYYAVSKTAPVAELSTVRMLPSENITMGQTVELSLTLKCPWNVKPETVKVTPGKGIQSFGAPSIKREKTGWGNTTWRMTASIQPFINGKTEKGSISVELDRPVNDRARSLDAEIPAFNSAPLDAGKSTELALAGKISPQDKKRWTGFLIVSVLVILAIIAALVIYFRSRKAVSAAAILMPWQIAIIEICELRKNLNDHRLAPAICFTRLTDIVRRYLEKRFSIKAESRTTYEFLDDMKRHNSPLQDGHKDFLRDFMQAADLVKFANLPADEDILGNALGKAEELIKSTTPREPTSPGLAAGKGG